MMSRSGNQKKTTRTTKKKTKYTFSDSDTEDDLPKLAKKKIEVKNLKDETIPFKEAKEYMTKLKDEPGNLTMKISLIKTPIKDERGKDDLDDEICILEDNKAINSEDLSLLQPKIELKKLSPIAIESCKRKLNDEYELDNDDISSDSGQVSTEHGSESDDECSKKRSNKQTKKSAKKPIKKVKQFEPRMAENKGKSNEPEIGNLVHLEPRTAKKAASKSDPLRYIDSVSTPTIGIRVGLSRKASNFKPLHPSAKRSIDRN